MSEPYDYKFPHKTSFHRCGETDTFIALCDDGECESASIFSCADWVIEQLAQRGPIRKRVYFADVEEGLVELVHDGEEFVRFVRLSAEQEQFLRRQLGVA